MRAGTKKEVTSKPKGKTVSNAVKLDPSTPIPFEYGGQAFTFINRQKYIPFLFPKDNFFQTLQEIKINSATQTACIETKKNYCAGRGLVDKNGKDFSPEFTNWLKCMNAKNENATALNRKFFGSHFSFGNTVIELVRFKVAGKPKLFIYVHNVAEWRKCWPDNNGIVRSAIMSKLFLKQGAIPQNILKDSITVPIYNPQIPNSKTNWVQDGNVERTVFWLQNDFEGYENYGMPDSIASLTFQVAEYKGIRYNLDNFDNNMVIAAILALKGNLSQEEADAIGKNIIKAHVGDGKRGRLAVVASEEGIDGSEFHQMQVKQDGSYIELDNKVMAKIIMAHQWHPLLAGMDQGNSLGKGNTFIRTIYEIKKKTVIDPMQQFLIENFWQPVQIIAKNWLGIDADKYELDIRDIDPISILSDVDPSPAITVNEVREANGLPLDTTEKGDMYLGELVPPKPSPAIGKNDV